MKKLVFIIAAFLMLSGCTDRVLDLDNKNQLAEGNFWSSADDAELALMGVYSSLQSTYVFNSDPWGGGAMRLDFVSDNGYVNSGWSWIPLAQLERSEFNATSYGNSETFSALYDVVTRANKVITKTPEIESITQGTADRIVGEAQTLRATAYLMLAMTYGDVPLVEEPLTVAESEVGNSSK